MVILFTWSSSFSLSVITSRWYFSIHHHKLWIVAHSQILALAKWCWQGLPFVQMLPIAVRGDTYWLVPLLVCARPMGSGQEQLQFVRVSSSRTYLNSVYWCLIGSWYVKFAWCLLPFSLVINCGNLQNPLFGKVVLTGTTFGSSATYSCQRGYILVGWSTRTCQDNGQWSGVAPVCRSKQLSTSVYTFRHFSTRVLVFTKFGQ